MVSISVACWSSWLAVRAVRERDRANYEVYVATMNLMRPAWDQNNLERMQDLLREQREALAKNARNP